MHLATDGAPMNTDDKRFDWITEKIIGCAFLVHNKMGCGFSEKVYENSLLIELRNAGLSVLQQVPIEVRYDGHVVGDYIADLIVEGTVIIEIKAVRAFDDVHSAQCINYLAATGLPVCLLINFGKRVEVKRFAGQTLS
jgi:GxxExxY protein